MAGEVLAARGCRQPRRRFCHCAVPLLPSLWGSWPPFPAVPPCFCWQWREKLAGLLHPPSGYTGEAISIAFSQKSWSVSLERVKGLDIILKEVVCSTFAYIASISSTVT